MEKITVTAKTYDEAITKALIGLQTTSDHMVVDIIEKGSAGFFGVIGARSWTIQARVKTEEEEAAEQKAVQEKAAAEKRAAQEKAAAEKKAAQEKAAAEKKAAQEKARPPRKRLLQRRRPPRKRLLRRRRPPRKRPPQKRNPRERAHRIRRKLLLKNPSEKQRLRSRKAMRKTQSGKEKRKADVSVTADAAEKTMTETAVDVRSAQTLWQHRQSAVRSMWDARSFSPRQMRSRQRPRIS